MTMDDIRILQNHIIKLGKEMENEQINLHYQGKHMSFYMQLNNKCIDNLVTMIQ